MPSKASSEVETLKSETSRELPNGWVRAVIMDVCMLNPPKPKPADVPEATEVSFVPMPAVDAGTRTIARAQVRRFSDVQTRRANPAVDADKLDSPGSGAKGEADAAGSAKSLGNHRLDLDADFDTLRQVETVPHDC
jgi:hypothetical protein